jgi:hypothetical protein
MVPFRFEVSLNGRVLCIAGMDRDGIIDVTIQSESLPVGADGTSIRGSSGNEHRISVTGYTYADEAWNWTDVPVVPGDEIRIRVLGAGPFDPPVVEEPVEGD